MTSIAPTSPAGPPVRERPRLAEIVRVAATQGWGHYLERRRLPGQEKRQERKGSDEDRHPDVDVCGVYRPQPR